MKTAIYGIGNILMGNDGIGSAVVRYLSSNYTLPPDTTLEDLGTPSLDLPAYLAGYDRVIFIDAVALDAPPGTVRVFSRDEITSVPTGASASAPTSPPSTTPSSSSTSPAPRRGRWCWWGWCRRRWRVG